MDAFQFGNIGVSAVTAPAAQIGLTWTSTSDDVRPTFRLADVPEPAAGDSLSIFFGDTEYSKTITYSHLYNLDVSFPEIPELVNDTWDVYAVYTPDGGEPIYSNVVSVTIDVPYFAPTLAGVPTIVRSNDGFGEIFTVTPNTFTGRPVAVSTLQWNRDGTPISGATGTTYTRQSPDDDGATITCTQTVTNSEGSDSETSTGIYVPIPAYFHSYLASFHGGYGSTTTRNNVDFGSYSGTRDALIFVSVSYSGRQPTAITVDGVSATRLDTEGSSKGLWTIPVTDGGLHTVVITATPSGFAQVVLAVGTLASHLSATPQDLVKDSGSSGTQVTYLPDTTVPADGVQIVWAKYCLDSEEGVPPFVSAIEEGYAYGSQDQDNFLHVCSSQFDIRMKQNRTSSWRAWGYMGAIFEPA